MNRATALDIARGFAVVLMVFVHFVPLDGATPLTLNLLEGVGAALFCVLIGMSWAIQVDRIEPGRVGRWVFGRSLTLLALGVLMHVTVWPTEVLVPFALMMAPALIIRRGGTPIILISIIALLAISFWGGATFSAFAETDWNEDGSHLADSTVGWATLNYLFIDGNYPLMPWLAFPLFGMLIERSRMDRQWLVRWCLGGGVLGAIVILAGWNVTWVPTSPAFVLLKGGLAVALIAGLSLVALPAWLSGIGCMGRASLTHYLAHICLLFVPLRAFYPAEDWSWQVGVIATMGYLAVALPLSVWWFKMHPRGPLEEMVRRLSSGRSA